MHGSVFFIRYNMSAVASRLQPNRIDTPYVLSTYLRWRMYKQNVHSKFSLVDCSPWLLIWHLSFKRNVNFYLALFLHSLFLFFPPLASLWRVFFFSVVSPATVFCLRINLWYGMLTQRRWDRAHEKVFLVHNVFFFKKYIYFWVSL